MRLMTDLFGHLLFFVAVLALLNIGATATWRALKIASSAIPKEAQQQVTRLVWIVCVAGAAAIISACVLLVVFCLRI